MRSSRKPARARPGPFRATATGLAALLAAATGGCSGSDHPQPVPVTLLAAQYPPGALLSLWSGGPGDLWVVGGKQGASVVLRHDGATWHREEPPVRQQLWWVHGFAGGPVFVCGAGGALARFDRGRGWTMLDSGHPHTVFYGVWGATESDIWVVGGPDFATASPEGDIVLRGDGTTFARVRVPALDAKPASAQKDLFKVWGSSSRDVFVVGGSGVILHFDGQTWTRQDGGAGNEPIFTVAGRSAHDVYAVGGQGAPTLLRYDGRIWTRVELPASAPPGLQGVWTAPGQPVWISGYRGFLAAWHGGRDWRVAPAPTSMSYHAVLGHRGGVLAAGGNIAASASEHVGVLATSGVSLGPP